MLKALNARAIDLGRYSKRAILLLLDYALLNAALWIGYAIRYDNRLYLPATRLEALLMVLAPLITIAVLIALSIYRLVTRFIDRGDLFKIAVGVLFSALLWAVVVFMVGQYGVPRSVIAMYAAFATVALVGHRLIINYLLTGNAFAAILQPGRAPVRTVVIYGANPLGVSLLDSLRKGGERRVVGFLDGASSLWGQYVHGLKVYRPDKLATLIARASVEEVLVALPESSRHERRATLLAVQKLPVTIRVLPEINEIATGKVSVTNLRSINFSDLLGREQIQPRGDLLTRSIHGKSVLVSGGGGSIGSELARQILRLEPDKLVLYDISEVALYQIEMELRERMAALGPDDRSDIEIVAVLGSVLDRDLIGRTIAQHGIECIFHAAAYKHVPMVEQNPCIGVHNNTIGTAVIAEAALAHGVQRFVFVSTDKAVRPTNVMGASKRLAELVLQAHAAGNPGTVFAMVRFGNVLDSSGSVVRLFRRQIEDGGPVTVTHPDVIRYFMSIPEAAELVIQAGAMAAGGEVFVLDMGEPVKINDLAQMMIRMMGFEVRSPDNPDGDIEIVYTGLRPGEKLYEELLVGENTSATEHPSIRKSHEPLLSGVEIKQAMADIEAAIAGHDTGLLKEVLSRTVEDFQKTVQSDDPDVAIGAAGQPPMA